MSKPIRTFIAFPLSEAACDAVTELQNQLKSTVDRHAVRWSNPQTIHLTLHFLGDVPTTAVPAIEEAMQQALNEKSDFTLQLQGFGCFPNLHRPRVLWVGIVGETPRLVKLHQELGATLQQSINFELEKRPYSPHLTIGRVKQGLSTPQVQQLGQQLAQTTIGHVATLPVNQLSLYQSELRPQGPIYTPLATVQLR